MFYKEPSSSQTVFSLFDFASTWMSLEDFFNFLDTTFFTTLGVVVERVLSGLLTLGLGGCGFKSLRPSNFLREGTPAGMFLRETGLLESSAMLFLFLSLIIFSLVWY